MAAIEPMFVRYHACGGGRPPYLHWFCAACHAKQEPPPPYVPLRWWNRVGLASTPMVHVAGMLVIAAGGIGSNRLMCAGVVCIGIAIVGWLLGGHRALEYRCWLAKRRALAGEPPPVVPGWLRWMRRLEIGVWLVILASLVAPFFGFHPVPDWLDESDMMVICAVLWGSLICRSFVTSIRLALAPNSLPEADGEVRPDPMPHAG